MKKCILIVVIIALLCPLSGCAKKEPTTADAFAAHMQEVGFETQDTTEFLSSALIETLITATSISDGYSINYALYGTSGEAAASFSGQKAYYDELKNTVYNKFSNELPNNGFYKLVSDGMAYYVSRVDNTIISCEATDQYTKDIDQIFKDLGY